MKKSLLILTLTLVTAFTSMAEYNKEAWDVLKEVRFDYLDDSGNRLFSAYPYSGSTLFNVFYSDREDDFDVMAFNMDNAKFQKITTVAPGIYSYPLEVSQDKDVTVKVETVASNATRATSGETSLEVRNGEKIRLTIDIQTGAYPKIAERRLYSWVYPDSTEYIYENRVSFLRNAIYPSQLFSIDYINNAQYRARVVEANSGNGDFSPDPTVPGRWTVEMYMPNEPMELNVSYEYADSETLNKFVEAASQMLYRAYSQFNKANPFFSGEPWAGMFCGEFLTQDNYTSYYEGFEMSSSLDMLRHSDYWAGQIPWMYYTSMADMANMYLELLDKFQTVPEAERTRAEGVFRTLRANAYLRFLQIFGPRYEDSKNGTLPVAPILTEWGKVEVAPANFREVADFCRADLEWAINNLGGERRTDVPVPDRNVARGLLTRLSLVTHDWMTAREQSQEILQAYNLTSNEDMKAGFFTPADSWIWTGYCRDINDIGTYSYQCSNAVNGGYSIFWGAGTPSDCIDYDLYRTMGNGDIRKEMFITPDKSVRPITAISWWNANNFNEKDLSINKNSSIWNLATNLLNKYKPGNIDSKPDYMGDPKLSFGSQMKFWSTKWGNYSDQDYTCLMRADEMLLAFAEASFELGDEMAALESVNRLNSLRQQETLFMGRGEALRDEIRRTRRIELWGEGFNFFDFKRWNIPIHRNRWIAGDSNSNNFPANSKAPADVSVSDCNGWRYVIPNTAVRYNPMMDVSKYEYTEAYGYETQEASLPEEYAPAESTVKMPGKAQFTDKNPFRDVKLDKFMPRPSYFNK